MAKDNRFEVVENEGGWNGPTRTVLLDTATGVQYLFVQNGNGAGLCPLLDKDGKPLCWNI